MLDSPRCFTPFKASTHSYSLPPRFTFPFYYDPHPLCLLATKELQEYLKAQTHWQHNFGLDNNLENAIGKMFGVLLVKNRQGELGYLSAFSGKLADQNHLEKFVPPVFDMLDEGSFFRKKNREINVLNDAIVAYESNPTLAETRSQLNVVSHKAMSEIAQYRAQMTENKKKRKQQRSAAAIEMQQDEFSIFKDQLAKQSILDKNKLRELNHYWDIRMSVLKNTVDNFNNEIKSLKEQRKHLSSTLQNKLFDQYRFLNIYGVEKKLRDIFLQTPQQVPPAGSGECAAPKLLQYAFKHQLKPIALAEFWWGASPKSAIRKHGNFYPACQGKCQPILGHMLEGIEMDENPLLVNPAEGKALDIIYEDNVMLVVNKPAEMLSVPGKFIEDSVYLRIKQRYPQATGPLIVHRLDMSTSGLLVIALNKDAHKNLQRQFIKRTVRKRYVALLAGFLKEERGTINLPLRGDLNDRPRQRVCYKHGKLAETRWHVIERNTNSTKVYFYPVTGRTHQLRVHAAHPLGLDSAIVGDDLYGIKGERLHLHAELLVISHPSTRKVMQFQIKEAF